MNNILTASNSADINLSIDSKTLDMCIKTIHHFGATTYKNICNGQMTTIPTGQFDWLLFWIAMAFVTVILLLLFTVLFKFMFD